MSAISPVLVSAPQIPSNINANETEAVVAMVIDGAEAAATEQSPKKCRKLRIIAKRIERNRLLNDPGKFPLEIISYHAVALILLGIGQIATQFHWFPIMGKATSYRPNFMVGYWTGAVSVFLGIVKIYFIIIRRDYEFYKNVVYINFTTMVVLGTGFVMQIMCYKDSMKPGISLNLFLVISGLTGTTWLICFLYAVGMPSYFCWFDCFDNDTDTDPVEEKVKNEWLKRGKWY